MKLQTTLENLRISDLNAKDNDFMHINNSREF